MGVPAGALAAGALLEVAVSVAGYSLLAYVAVWGPALAAVAVGGPATYLAAALLAAATGGPAVPDGWVGPFVVAALGRRYLGRERLATRVYPDEARLAFPG